jgi:hypothetical protein
MTRNAVSCPMQCHISLADPWCADRCDSVSLLLAAPGRRWVDKGARRA